MRTFLIGFAYFLIFSTPIQIGFLLLALWALFSSDYTFITLSGHVFWHEYLTFFLFFYHWIFSWFWNDLLNLVFGMPVIILITFKLLVNGWLGLWLLPVAKAMPVSKPAIANPVA